MGTNGLGERTLDNSAKYSHWEDIALYDLGTADAMFQSGRYLYVVFMCQQAMEKLSKGLHVYYKGDEAPRTHNIHVILQSVFEEKALHGDSSNFTEKYAPFFAELVAYYISERYPSYREKLSISIGRDKAKEVLDQSKEAFTWLQSLKK